MTDAMKRIQIFRWTPKVYNRIARLYDSFSWLFAPVNVDAHQRIVADLPSGSLLDVGCGTGTLLALAHDAGMCCYGIDTSEGMLRQARAKVPQAELKIASFYQIPYARESFDYVVESHALSGLRIDTGRALAEMLRVCKIGGQIRLADYGVPATENWITRITTRLGAIIGDYPQDYTRLFQMLGYSLEINVLGGYGMYQLIQVKKTH
jgi:ubiquinone/menaquinone biosynthesis C-methylase UbiE